MGRWLVVGSPGISLWLRNRLRMRGVLCLGWAIILTRPVCGRGLIRRWVLLFSSTTSFPLLHFPSLGILFQVLNHLRGESSRSCDPITWNTLVVLDAIARLDDGILAQVSLNIGGDDDSRDTFAGDPPTICSRRSKGSHDEGREQEE